MTIERSGLWHVVVALATLAIGMAVHPICSLVFGRIGDMFGRKTTAANTPAPRRMSRRSSSVHFPADTADRDRVRILRRVSRGDVSSAYPSYVGLVAIPHRQRMVRRLSAAHRQRDRGAHRLQVRVAALPDFRARDVVRRRERVRDGELSPALVGRGERRGLTKEQHWTAEGAEGRRGHQKATGLPLRTSANLCGPMLFLG
jgi:hypothetical protein